MKQDQTILIGLGLVAAYLLLKPKTSVQQSYYPGTTNPYYGPNQQPQGQSVVLPLLNSAASIVANILKKPGAVPSPGQSITPVDPTTQSIQDIQNPVLTQQLPNFNPTAYVDPGSASPTGIDVATTFDPSNYDPSSMDLSSIDLSNSPNYV